ncbi:MULTISPECIES: leucyl/phenylalanyl-tRNA--protein transferase [unclassified Marinobacter]|uniref:leucyl/phenylalanyl-tRNA--protein transferase n=1 Tax=unclassified Marinobacter TaxID=83889 RepID=UPI000BF5B50E|nr:MULTISPECIES: leucyl/phenylalanyl-tRNA--protein transferase [unclassified Marinobacter]PFG09097.1 leucyl/phenylalanyl-tRNA--protein transferase [Marinobacter sp. LV10MA510-1]PFG54961.1 leucyl/phenylalanyl-tRNA--protein transferase [Marinobacter sp. LV10R520-4]
MTSLPWLPEHVLWFPPPESALAEPDGLLAAGGDLSSKRLMLAYENGIFPWYSDDQPILWWSPDPRCVIFPENIHISRSLRRSLNKGYFTITADRAFSRIMRLCGSTRAEGTWITENMLQAYNKLHREGIAHSIEAWNPHGELAGGMYGIALGSCFFGESMFSLETNASKVLMVHLANQLRQWGYRIIDCQIASDHLLSMGAQTLPRTEFLALLGRYTKQPPAVADWQFQWRWPGSEGE